MQKIPRSGKFYVTYLFFVSPKKSKSEKVLCAMGWGELRQCNKILRYVTWRKGGAKAEWQKRQKCGEKQGVEGA